MQEKRKLKRRHLIYYLRVFDRNSNELLGHLVDITPEGIMLMSEETIPTKNNLELRMVLPSKLFGKDKIEFNATSLWSKGDIMSDFYDTGFRLTKIDRKDAELIESLIDTYGFRD